MDVKIIVCCHKEAYVPKGDIYLPIHVGKQNSHVTLPYIGDNTGDNISELNGLYCEMTGMYWAWKNIKADYVGLCHYRRYFSFDKKCSLISTLRPCYKKIMRLLHSLSSQIYNDGYFTGKFNVHSEQELSYLCQKFEADIYKFIGENPDVNVFALKPICIGSESVYMKMGLYAGDWHIKKVLKIVKEMYPTYYESFSETLSSNTLYYANMILLKKELLDEYCEFVFNVLEKHLSACLNEGMYNSLEEGAISRLSGYISEILTSSFVLYKIKQNKKQVKLLNQIQYI